MKTIKASTKQGQHFLNAYRRSRFTSIKECYGRYSNTKYIAERDCKETMRKTGGEGYKVISHCTHVFTCGWMTAEGNLRVETHCNTYLIVIDKEDGR